MAKFGKYFLARQAELGRQALPSGETVKELPNV
jgi:hypothetical protein